MINIEAIYEILGTEPGIYFITTHGQIIAVHIRETPSGRRVDQYPLGCVVRLSDVHRLLDWLGVLSPRAAGKIAELDYECDVFAQMVRNICNLPRAVPAKAAA